MEGWVGDVGWLIADGVTTNRSPVQLAVWHWIWKVRRPRPAFYPLCYAADYNSSAKWQIIIIFFTVKFRRICIDSWDWNYHLTSNLLPHYPVKLIWSATHLYFHIVRIICFMSGEGASVSWVFICLYIFLPDTDLIMTLLQHFVSSINNPFQLWR